LIRSEREVERLRGRAIAMRAERGGRRSREVAVQVRRRKAFERRDARSPVVQDSFPFERYGQRLRNIEEVERRDW
jgi:hypothetical protein